MVTLKKYKMYIKIGIKKLNYLRQLIKKNNRRTQYKIKKFSYIISIKKLSKSSHHKIPETTFVQKNKQFGQIEVYTVTS